MQKFAAVIPALNEAASIGGVVRKLPSSVMAIVVDDGSTDATANVASQAGAIVVTHAVNRGYDAALATGIDRARSLGLAFAVTIDADGQHEPLAIERFIKLLGDGADLVAGVRDRRQRIAEVAFSWAGRIIWRLHDPLCGMKGYRLAAFADAGAFDPYKSIGTYFAVFAACNRLAIVQTPVATRPRVGKPRFGQGFRANLVILRALSAGVGFTISRRLTPRR